MPFGDDRLLLSVSAYQTNGIAFEGLTLPPTNALGDSFALVLSKDFTPLWAVPTGAARLASVSSDGTLILSGDVYGQNPYDASPQCSDMNVPGNSFFLAQRGPIGPRLEVAQDKGSFELSWPNLFSSYKLEKTSSVFAPWGRVETATLVNGIYRFKAPFAENRTFYRLRRID